MANEITTTAPMDLIQKVQHEANALAESGELDRYAIVLDHIGTIANDSQKETVGKILTRVNTVAAARKDYVDAYAKHYYGIYKKLKEVSDQITQQPLIIKYRAISMIDQRLDYEAKKLALDQEILVDSAARLREDDLKKAQEAAIAGDMQAALQHKANADAVMVPILQEQPIGLEGVSVSPKSVAEVTDVMAFLKGIVNGLINLSVTMVKNNRKEDKDAAVSVTVSQTVLDEYANSTWPGVTRKDKRNYRTTRRAE